MTLVGIIQMFGLTNYRAVPRYERELIVSELQTMLRNVGYEVSEADFSDSSYLSVVEKRTVGRAWEISDPNTKLMPGYRCYFNFGPSGIEQQPKLLGKWEDGSCTVDAYVFATEEMAHEAEFYIIDDGQQTSLPAGTEMQTGWPSYIQVTVPGEHPHWYRYKNIVFVIDCNDETVWKQIKELLIEYN